jgi:acyl-CoA dehydrogenase
MTDLGDLLGDSVSRLFADHADSAALAHRYGWQGALWQRIQELGLNLTLVPEDKGGVAGTWEDAFAVLHAAGFHQIPLPISENMLAARLCSDAGLPAPSGPATVAAYSQGSLSEPASGLRYSGRLNSVPWGRDCETIVTVALLHGKHFVIALPRESSTLEPAVNLAGEPRDTLLFEEVAAAAAPSAAPEAQHLLEYCALARLPQIVGCLESALKRTIQYATERKQFGKAIGQFQAVQQLLAVFGADAAAVACAAKAACRAAACGPALFQIGSAKLRANQAIGLASASAHQVHAAIGFTWDHPLHHATQRLWSWRSEFGNDRFWSERLGAEVAARGADLFWSDLTARDDLAGSAAR